VVITVVVVLLALLAPALHQAVYAAEMASCAARLKGISTGSYLRGEPAAQLSASAQHRRELEAAE